MRIRPLIIGPEQLKQIDEAVVAARANPTPWEVLKPFALGEDVTEVQLEDRKRGNAELMRKLVSRSTFVELPHGYLVAISFEHQPSGLCRHLSVSVSDSEQGKMPSVPAIKMITEAFGFRSAFGDRMWTEEFAPGEYAVNIIQLEGATH